MSIPKPNRIPLAGTPDDPVEITFTCTECGIRQIAALTNIRHRYKDGSVLELTCVVCEKITEACD